MDRKNSSYYQKTHSLTHVRTSCWQIRREQKKHCRDNHICQTDLLPGLKPVSLWNLNEHTRLAVQPTILDTLKGRVSGSIFRPRIQFIAIGMPYETPNATTEAEMIALKALVKLAKGGEVR
jgi:hypothetical protein